MGLFGGGDQPTLDLSGVRSQLEGLAPGISGAFDVAGGLAEERAPLALGARESALGDIGTPEAATQFFGGFQPTSFEQGIAGSFFENALERAKRTAGQRASLGGIESAFPELFSRAIGPTIGNIGQFLAGQGQQRAMSSLEARLGIDPFSGILNPLAEGELRQGNLRTQALADLERQQAFANFAQQQAEAQNRASGIGSLGTLLGGGAGFLLGGPGGAALGASLGGQAAPLFGGTQGGFNLGDALAIQQAFPSGAGGGGGTTGQQPGTLARRLGFAPQQQTGNLRGQTQSVFTTFPEFGRG